MLNSDLITSVSDYNLNSALLDNGGTTPKQETSKSKSNNLSKYGEMKEVGKYPPVAVWKTNELYKLQYLPLRFLSTDIEALYQRKRRANFRLSARLTFPILFVLLVILSWESISIHSGLAGIIILQIVTLLCFFITTLASFTKHSYKPWYGLLSIFVHCNCCLGIFLSFTLGGDLKNHLYMLVPFGLSFIISQYQLKTLVAGLIYQQAAIMLVAVFGGSIYEVWQLPYLTAIVSGKAMAVSLFLEYFIRKIYAKEIKLKVELQRIKNENEKSEVLLTNLVPPQATRGQPQTNSPVLERFNSCTLVGIDILYDFSVLSNKQESTMERVFMEASLINEVHSVIESIARKHDVQIIKAHATEYLCSSGIPVPTMHHAKRAADFALEVLGMIQCFGESGNGLTQQFVKLRMSLVVGGCYAGLLVTDSNKISYDVWGKLVEEASKLKDSGPTGQIYCSQSALKLLSSTHRIESLEEISALVLKGAAHSSIASNFRVLVPDALEIAALEKPVNLMEADLYRIAPTEEPTSFINRYLLNFSSPSMESNYKIDFRSYYARIHRWNLLLCVIIMALFGISDIGITKFETSCLIRYVGICVMGVPFAVTFLARKYQVYDALNLTFVSIAIATTILGASVTFEPMYLLYFLACLSFISITQTRFLAGSIFLIGSLILLIGFGSSDQVAFTIKNTLVGGIATAIFCTKLLRDIELRFRMTFLLRYMVQDKQRSMANERAKNDKILANVLPKQLVVRFKATPKEIVELTPMATIMAFKLVGLDEMEGELNPVQFSSLILSLYSRIDLVLEASSAMFIRKSSTLFVIGCGLLGERNHAATIADLALSLVEAISEFNKRNLTDSPLSVRIGISSGETSYGVLGRSRIIFDVWGEAPNEALSIIHPQNISLPEPIVNDKAKNLITESHSLKPSIVVTHKDNFSVTFPTWSLGKRRSLQEDSIHPFVIASKIVL